MTTELPKKLILTVGLPKSGKTTWAMAQGCPVVCPDAIRWATYGQRFWGPGEEQVWATAWTMMRALFMAGHEKVIVDACNNTKKCRDFWVRDTGEIWQMGTEFAIHIVGTEEDECMRRAAKAGDEDIIPVIRRMGEEYESPFVGDSHVPPFTFSA